MLLSIIVPCYNVGPLLTSLMERITAQMGDDCELVLVNDGSTDQTSALAQAFVAAYQGPGQIMLKETANAGAAKARERGLGLARGEFIYFCDSDDILHAEFVASFRRSLQQFPELEMLFFSSEIAVTSGPDGSTLQRLGRKVEYSEQRVFEPGHRLLAYNLAQGMYTAAVWTFVVRRRLVTRTNASFTRRGAHEDHLFTLGAIVHATQIVAIPDLLYTQKVRQGSLTNSRKNAAYLMDRIDAYYEADALLRADAPRLRPSYDRWSFDSIMAIVNENRALLPAVLGHRRGFRYFATNPGRVMSLLLQRCGRFVKRRVRRADASL